MKKEGFTVPDEGISALGDVEKPARRTPLTPGEQFKLDCLVVHALCDPARLRLGLSVLEQRTLDQTMARFTTKLDLRNPANFVKKWKEAFDLIAPLDRFDGDARTDRQTLLKAAKNALGYRGSGPKLADTIERWLHSTSPDGADLQKKWKEAMSFMRNAHARSAFQDCICTFLKEKKPRAGAQQGLLRALEESSTKDNPEEVARMIAEAARRVKKKE
jgi:hypothetical protein